MKTFIVKLGHNGTQLNIILRENFGAVLKSIIGNLKSIIIGTSLTI